MKCWIIILFAICSSNLVAQDSLFARAVVDTLSSPFFWGRGYTNDGMKKASNYIVDQFNKWGIEPLSGKSFYQKFNYSVNTFPGKMEVFINDKLLRPGIDYIVSPQSKSIRARGILAPSDSTHFVNPNYRFLVGFEDKLTWSVATEAADYSGIVVDKKWLREIPVSFQADIQSEMVNNFRAANVCGMVKGTEQPDSFLVLSAHYDHLGGMGGGTYFPGANDNASGVALLLSLAKYYASNPPRYSVAFLCFAGEEAGLIGSKYFTENPIIPLQTIKFLVNLDLEGTGEEGITVVNATEYQKAFEVLCKINQVNNYLIKVNARTKAANSDHYWFTEKGVPAFFFYTLGGIKAYHDVYDRPETLPLTEYNDLFRLITHFFASF